LHNKSCVQISPKDRVLACFGARNGMMTRLSGFFLPRGKRIDNPLVTDDDPSLPSAISKCPARSTQWDRGVYASTNSMQPRLWTSSPIIRQNRVFSNNPLRYVSGWSEHYFMPPGDLIVYQIEKTNHRLHRFSQKNKETCPEPFDYIKVYAGTKFHVEGSVKIDGKYLYPLNR
jgi:hypothetical protein